MKRCKHRRVIMYRRKGDAWEHTMTLSGVTLMWKRFFECDRAHCGDCGHQMALAPATDTGPHAASVAVEVRAAEIADNLREQSYRPGCDRFEWCPQNKSDELCDLCQAHVLAHDIAEHTEES